MSSRARKAPAAVLRIARRTAFVVAALSLGGGLSAAAGERVRLWPEGRLPDAQAHQIAAMTDESGAKGFDRAAHTEPYLEWFDPPARDKANGICMILIGGGGYNRCCDVAYVRYWREHFTAMGAQCVNLVYRTPRPKGLPFYWSAWEDGQRAVRLVRAEASKRGFDPERIGTISMSAGSHLATLLATSSQTPATARVDALDDVPCHINFAITCAIAYGLSDGDGIVNTRRGEAIDVTLSPEFKFDAKTCPMCMFHGGNDICSPRVSTAVYRQLRRMKVPAELHLFADRPHGFFGKDGRGEAATGYDNWFGRAAEFIRQMNFDGRLGKEVGLQRRYASDTARATCERQDLWPAGKTPDFFDHQCRPYLEWHVPKALKTRAIQVIYSGGGYNGSHDDNFEVLQPRRYFVAKGMTVVTVKYRAPRPKNGLAKHTSAWQDLQRAIRLVRSQAASRGLDPDRIGIMGGSAGGHLTMMGATSSRSQSYARVDKIDDVPCNVQWAVAIYPAFALTDGVEKPNCGGGNADDARIVPEFVFDPDTCPVLFLHGDADVWASMNSVKCWEQLRRMGIQGELHTYAKRGHCFYRSGAPGTGSYTMLDRVWEFLNHKGFNR